MASLTEFARAELAKHRDPKGKPDPYYAALERDVLVLVAVFEAQGHSGASAKFVSAALDRILQWKSLDVGAA